ncbi:MAG TPA: hypothetical protein VK629_09655 [Steroidobacteraceae bacterium]|nr:hypothetical protein [Steroidobacteraceae bacterium]
MVDHTPDSMTATGRHRAWVGERNLSERGAAPAVDTAQRQNVGGPRNWVSRPAQPPAAPPNSRHAAITKRLSNFPNYKSWAEKAKSNWHDDKPE